MRGKFFLAADWSTIILLVLGGLPFGVDHPEQSSGFLQVSGGTSTSLFWAIEPPSGRVINTIGQITVPRPNGMTESSPPGQTDLPLYEGDWV